MRKLIEYVRGIIKPRKVPEDTIQDGGESAEELKPMFYVGDSVHLYNPYEGEFMSSDMFSVEPERYEVVASKYDHDEEVFRYKLEGDDLPTYSFIIDSDKYDADVWYSEDWLSLPTTSKFARVERRNISEIEEELAMRMTQYERELEAKVLTDEMDEDLRKREIDRFLDLLREGTAEEREQAERELRKITGGMAE